jgi:hypothetical protein
MPRLSAAGLSYAPRGMRRRALAEIAARGFRQRSHSVPRRSPPHWRNFVLCFRSLFNTGRGYAFPCDAEGHVDLDRMSERARCNYFFARAMVGREVAVPEVEKPPHH